MPVDRWFLNNAWARGHDMTYEKSEPLTEDQILEKVKDYNCESDEIDDLMAGEHVHRFLSGDEMWLEPVLEYTVLVFVVGASSKEFPMCYGPFNWTSAVRSFNAQIGIWLPDGPEHREERYACNAGDEVKIMYLQRG